MSAAKYKKFTGYVGWNHLVVPDEYLGEKKWKMDFYPDDYNALKDMGSRLQLDKKAIADGKQMVRPARNVSKVFDGKLTEFTPPVLTYEGKPYDGKYIPKGSRVEVDLCFYNAGKFGTGTRLQAVKILELAEEEERPAETENQALEQAEEPTTKERKPKLPF
jgi:hypothetical protein